MRKSCGFAILLTTIILSVAVVIYTSNMVVLQLMDNKVLGNYYRNSEAFVNAESGVNLILNKLDTVEIASEMLLHLPFNYPEKATLADKYHVTVTDIGANKLFISSIGLSKDGSASRTISLKVYYHFSFEIPDAALLSNGKLKVDKLDSINDGCEGVASSQCRNPGNIAKQLIVSQPNVSAGDNETSAPKLCSSDFPSAENLIDLNAIDGELFDQDGLTRFQEINDSKWGEAALASGLVFDQVAEIKDVNSASSLFESTFGKSWEATKQQLIKSTVVAHIDMTGIASSDCAQLLENVDQDVAIIYIEGDCKISSQHSVASNTSTNNHFTIGSPDNPKMVFMEGGRFVLPPKTTSSVIGMLYLMPATHDLIDANGNPIYIDGVKQTQQDQEINLAGIRVNGALLSDYHCSASDHPMGSANAEEYFSIRYDKNILNTLYQQIGMTPYSSQYQLVAGSWRDF